jgi:hypothetical protein
VWDLNSGPPTARQSEYYVPSLVSRFKRNKLGGWVHVHEIKVVPTLNHYTFWHMGGWRHGSTHSLVLRTRWQVSVRLKVQVDSSPGKEPPVNVRKEAGLTQSLSWQGGDVRDLFRVSNPGRSFCTHPLYSAIPDHIYIATWFTIDGVWIGNRIYWELTERNYSTNKVLSVFTSRCLIAASNGDRSPSSGFPNCLRPQLPASHFRICNSELTQPTTQSQSYFTTGGLPSISSSWRQAPWGSRPRFFL